MEPPVELHDQTEPGVEHVRELVVDRALPLPAR
jgi:hypothetical protein